MIFGRGKISDAATEARRLGMKHPLVITTAHQSHSGKHLVANTSSVLFAGAAMHTPRAFTEQAMAIMKAQGFNDTIALGGRSCTGLGKAIALQQLVIPTSDAGLKMTNILGETHAGILVFHSE